MPPRSVYSFFFNDTATTEIYTLSLHDALPISGEFEEHFRQLYSPGVPFPFECIHAVRVGDVRFVTERLRLAFADQRPNPNREFFTVSPERLRAVLELVQGVEQTLAEDAVASDQTDRIALDRARRRR